MTVFIATLLLPVAVGFLAIRGSRSEEGFHVGGRSMNRFLVALSAVSSGRSSWLVLGLAGIAYVKGVTGVWAVAGYVVVEMFQFILVGRRLRRETGTRSSLTLLDYFEHRFDRGGACCG